MTQPDGRLVCGCGKLFRLGEAQATSANPYATPICPSCFDEWLAEQALGGT